MRSSELVSPGHLARKAVIYVRQSTPHQVLTNRESLKLQYALKKRATELGWRADDVEVIDADLGFTGSEAQHREGFKDLTAKVVTLGRVGIVLSSEVTRLSRNCSDCGTRYWTSVATRDVSLPTTTASTTRLASMGGWWFWVSRERSRRWSCIQSALG